MAKLIDFLLSPATNLAPASSNIKSAFVRLGIFNIIDLLFHIPFRYEKIKTNPPFNQISNKELVKLNVEVVELPFISAKEKRNRRSPYKIPCLYEDRLIYLVYFNFIPHYLSSKIKAGSIIGVEGQVDRYMGELNLAHPKITFNNSLKNEELSLQPVYHLTYGTNQAQIASYIDKAMVLLENDYHNEKIKELYKLADFKICLENLHHPKNPNDLPNTNTNCLYRQRLAFDEILAQQIAIHKIKLTRGNNIGNKFTLCQEIEKIVRKDLPFQLTSWQEEALQEIKADMSSGKKMMRLLQGDVGCGKTIVAMLAALQAVHNKQKQSAIMAPLDILATQHYLTFVRYLAFHGIKIALLTGKIKGKKRENLLTEIAQGGIDIVIGTHALFQEKVVFNNLGLVIVDEQHRFGVMQRLELLSKSENSAADMLLMTATPIPRTLTQSIYGDLDVSVISQKPSNRKAIITALKPKKNIKELIESIVRSVEKGEKIYWICPLIEEQETDEDNSTNNKATSKTSVEERYKSFIDLLSADKIDYLHGKMNEDEKNQKVENFKHSPNGKLLISTTVIEVGIDVPEAKIIVIEDAEKFGLAQLHQLRGRVGRNGDQCYCILVYNYASPIAMERLTSLKATDDGFKIAELDLQLRGAGDVAGYKQSGLPDFKFFNWNLDKDLVKNAKTLAEEYIANDDHLANKIMDLFNKNSSSI